MNENSLSSYRFLIVDDIRLCRLGIIHTLRKLGCDKYQVAENGSDAISVLVDPNSNIDCVISDIAMPRMNGLQMLKFIRTGAFNIRRNTLVTMLTSHRERDLIQLAVQLDTNGFLLKPVSEETLKNHISRILYLYSATPSWLKPVEFYRDLTIPESINEMMSIERPDEEIAVIHQDICQNILPAVDEKGNVKVTPEEIMEQAVLAKDIVGLNGKILYQAGATLNCLDICKLRNLMALDVPLDDIWIRPST